MTSIFQTFLSCFVVAFFLIPLTAFAAHDDVGLFQEKVNIPEVMLEGKKYRFYATSTNLGEEDVKGIIRFFALSNQLGADQPVSVVAGKEDTVFIDAELPQGTHEILVRFIPFDAQHDNSENNAVSKKVTIVGDADRDGKPNNIDPDDDNDGVPDEEDAFPLDRKEQKDTDSDGTGDNRDSDDDNDGVPDELDAAPLDASESKDTDKDKVADKYDAFPKDPKESKDYDSDGQGDNSDSDADNDGVPKGKDVNDTNRPPEIGLTGLPAFPMVGQKIGFDITSIKDPDGSVKTVTVLLKTPAVPEPKPLPLNEKNKIELAIETPGDYEIRLTAVDDKGEKSERLIAFTARTPLFYTTALFLGLFGAILALFGIITYSTSRRRKKVWYKKLLKKLFS